MESVAVSVIMPVYNAERYLHEAIDSILKQTFRQFEFIIINDCSTDGCESIILSFTDPRIVYHKFETNQGVVAAMNMGLKLATAPFIAVMHADDIAMDFRLEIQYKYLVTHPETAVLAGRSLMIDETGYDTGEIWKLDAKTFSADEINKAMITENCIAHPTVMFRTDVINSYGYTSSPAHRGFAVEDYPLWLHILSDGHKIEKLKEVILKYRTHKKSATNAFLRQSNSYLVNFETKKFYLSQRKAMQRITSFDKKLQVSMYKDFILGQLKSLKTKVFK
jgi:glycosyltransferase involved in cell wall biosynthesis